MEDNSVSAIRVSSNSYVMEGNPDNNGYCTKPTSFNSAEFEPIANDILRLLPVDPFGMGVSTTTTFTVTGWVESNRKFSKLGNNPNVECETTDELKIFLNRAIKVHDKSSNLADGCFLIGNSNEFWSCYKEDGSLISQKSKESGKGSGSCSNRDDGGAPHDALFFALRYLGVKDLLSVEKVCKSLQSVVRNDVLLWRNIQIDYPLSVRISDEALSGLTKRAQGNLLSLSLLQCLRITDNGLKKVLESNPKLTKLNVTGCARLSVDGLVNNLKVFKSSGALGIKHLRIGGRYGLTQEHFDELKSLLNVDKCMPPKVLKPYFYHYGHFSLSCDDDRDIDIERCPRCNNVTVIYDCPAESCKGSTQHCRACIICIARCGKCGRCVNDSEYVETFCLDLLCLDCLCQEGHDEKGVPSKHMIFQHETTYCSSIWLKRL